MRGTLRGFWRALKVLVARRRQPCELVVLHLPAGQVAHLKQLAAGAGGMQLGMGGRCAAGLCT